MKSVLFALLTIALIVFPAVFKGLERSAIAGGIAEPIALMQAELAVLPGLKGAFAGERPSNIGVTNGILAPCPASPNCVVSQQADEKHAIAPIIYSSDRATARQALIDILGVVPGTKIVLQSDDYILAESESRLMGFVDDSEFYFPTDEKVIQTRAAARLGESDLGVNRRRIEQIRLAFKDLEQRAATSPLTQK
ncbi:MAG: DUF1499 domain-containing protein [Phormidesmis sp.]